MRECVIDVHTLYWNAYRKHIKWKGYGTVREKSSLRLIATTMPEEAVPRKQSDFLHSFWQVLSACL